MGLDHDPDRVARFVSEIRGALATLDRFGDLPEESFLADEDKVGNAKYNLIVAIEGCLDLSNHLISRNGLRIPNDYADTFGVLGEADVLDADLARDLAEMARFRNRLVHLYWDVDDALVHAFLREELGDVEAFLQQVGEALV